MAKKTSHKKTPTKVTAKVWATKNQCHLTFIYSITSIPNYLKHKKPPRIN